MRFDSMRSTFGSVFVVLASVLLGSCGGGGASTPGPQGGPLQILPAAGTFYAGVEYTFTVGGGRAPYFLSSSEPSLLAVPSQVNGNSFTVVPNNPGVIDAGLPPDSLPIRTANITVRDSLGQSIVTTDIQVAQNFFTGYGVSYTSNCSAVAPPPPAACAGGETLVQLTAAIAGNLVGNRTYRLEILRGPFFWVFPNGQIAGNTITVTTDHEGDAQAIFRVTQNVGTQIAVFRVIDVATGVSTTQVLNIEGIPLSGALEAIPDAFTFVGATTAQCGTGSGQFLVFDGTPPYRVFSASSSVLVTPSESNSQPGLFQINVSDPNTCLTDATIVVTDANNRRATITVNTEAGSADPPPPPISVTPQTIVLQCGVSGSVLIVGGDDAATFSSSSPDARINAVINARVMTLSRDAIDTPPTLPASPTPGVPNLISFSVTVTDGASTTTAGITAPSHCPP